MILGAPPQRCKIYMRIKNIRNFPTSHRWKKVPSVLFFSFSSGKAACGNGVQQFHDFGTREKLETRILSLIGRKPPWRQIVSAHWIEKSKSQLTSPWKSISLLAFYTSFVKSQLPCVWSQIEQLFAEYRSRVLYFQLNSAYAFCETWTFPLISLPRLTLQNGTRWD